MASSPPPAKRQRRDESASSTHSISLDPVSQFSGQSAVFKQPVEITCFSYDNQRNFHHDTSSMKYYYPAQLNQDLEKGFEMFNKFDDHDEHLDSLLASIQRYEETSGKESRVDIVTWRGIMTKIMTVIQVTPGFLMAGSIHERRKLEYECRKTQWDDVPPNSKDERYIEEEKDIEARKPVNRQHALAMYSGYKFEELSTLPKTWDECTRYEIEHRSDNIVDNIRQYCSVVRTQLGSSTIIMGGEVDCLWDYKPNPPENPVSHYVELKTSTKLRTDRQIQTFERQKLLKFWAQSFLLGVPRIIVGFRSETNVLVSTQTLETMHIPAQLRERRGVGMWDGNVCINFTARFLERLKEVVETEGIVYGLKLERGAKEVEIFQKGGESFLTDEYVRWKERGKSSET